MTQNNNAAVTETHAAHCMARSAIGLVTEPLPDQTLGSGKHNGVERGLTNVVSPLELQDRIQLATLIALNRFRVIRTFDIAVICFPERNYKAALSAAQRAMRGLVKHRLARRYVTDRKQHVYGLTARGAQLLRERGVDAVSSVRKVSNMTNPEHLLWANFIVCCCQARGLDAKNESELLQSLQQQYPQGHARSSGLAHVRFDLGNKRVIRNLRPDAVAYESDGLTWFEIDRSLRGQERARSLVQLFRFIGKVLHNEHRLRRVVVFAKSARIFERDLSLARKLIGDSSQLKFGAPGSVVLKELREGVFEMWGELEIKSSDESSSLQPRVFGYVVIQMLPAHLLNVRIDGKSVVSLEGWFPDNFLPYIRPDAVVPWRQPRSPFLPQ